MVEKAFTTGTVLKEISNSREANMEDLENIEDSERDKKRKSKEKKREETTFRWKCVLYSLTFS